MQGVRLTEFFVVLNFNLETIFGLKRRRVTLLGIEFLKLKLQFILWVIGI